MQCLDWNDHWHFHQVGTSRQAVVTLPHDAMINTPRNPAQHNYFLLAGFEGGTYVYEKTLTIAEAWREKEVYLELEGCYCMTQVYVQDKLAADHPYGFTPIRVRLSDYLQGRDSVTIRVEAHVPKDGHGRWYTGGGLYRPVHLYVGGSAYIQLDGLRITTLSHDPAVVQVEIQTQGGDTVALSVLREGETVLSATAPVESGRATCALTIPDAALWSAEHPHLYTLRAVLQEDGLDRDIVTERFGIRTLKLRSGQGFFVNGERVFLRGGCIHNDNGVIGVINNDATELHRARILKQTGFNALRSAHHPMSRSLLRACDELGLYVMDEAFDYWYRPKGSNPHTGRFLETFEEDTRRMVHDAYNHPCVVLYSIGNEIPEAGSYKGVRVGKRITDIIRSLDTSRFITLCPSVHWLREYLADTCYRDTDEDVWIAESPEHKQVDWQHYMRIFMGAVLNLPEDEQNLPYPPTFVQADEEATNQLYPYLDIAGYNYYEDRYEKLHELHPERLLLGTETRGTKIIDTMRFARSHPYLIGDFIWTLQEHLGEANCCGMHYDTPEEQALRNQGVDPLHCYPWLVNYGGTVDLIGDILPSIHLYEFAWDPQHHGLYLAAQPPVHAGRPPLCSSYRWTDSVDGWTFEGYEGQKTFVDAYTDAAEVAFFLNGQALGRVGVQAYFAKLPCVYEPGELLAIGYDAEGHALYRSALRTAGRENKICARADKAVLQSGGQDFCFIHIEITDDAGMRKLLPEHRVHISVQGPVSIQGFGSAYHKNEERYDQDSHMTYLGRLLAVVRSTDQYGDAVICLSSEGMESCTISLQVQ